MRFSELPEVGELGRSVWSNLLASCDGEGWSTAYSGAYWIDGNRAEAITHDRIAHVEYVFGESPEGYSSADIAALVRLDDGSWAACMAWSDTTGFGCRDGVQWKLAHTRHDAIWFGLDRDARRKLGLAEEKP